MTGQLPRTLCARASPAREYRVRHAAKDRRRASRRSCAAKGSGAAAPWPLERSSGVALKVGPLRRLGPDPSSPPQVGIGGRVTAILGVVGFGCGVQINGSWGHRSIFPKEHAKADATRIRRPNEWG